VQTLAAPDRQFQPDNRSITSADKVRLVDAQPIEHGKRVCRQHLEGEWRITAGRSAACASILCHRPVPW
jgi:hypothetical protein